MADARVARDHCQNPECLGCLTRRSWRGVDAAKAKLAARKTHALPGDVAALALENVVQP